MDFINYFIELGSKVNACLGSPVLTLLLSIQHLLNQINSVWQIGNLCDF